MKNIKYLVLSIILLWTVQRSGSSVVRIPELMVVRDGSGDNLSNERIYVQTDRDIYIAGENLFFKIYLYDEGQKKLSDNSKIAYLVICNSEKQITRLCLPLSGGIGYGSLSLPDTLKTGSYNIVAFTNWMRNFGEAGFFRKQICIANRFDEKPAFEVLKGNEIIKTRESNNSLTISTDRKSYHQREKVTLNLLSQLNHNTNISISVVESPPEKFNHTNLVSELSAADRSDVQRLINNNDNLKKCKYLPEDKGYVISGFVKNLSSRAGILVRLSAPDTIDNLMYSTTNTNGKFFFQLNDFYYNKDLYISIPDQVNELSAVIQDDKYAFNQNYKLTDSLIPDKSIQFIKKCQTIANINKAYNIQPVKSETVPAIRDERKELFSQPDYKILMADFVPLKDFIEIVKETLPFVRLRKNKNNYELDILDRDNKTFIKNPAVFVNGMLINNINYMISFGSDKIQRIEAVCHTRVYGPMVFNGILSVFTSPDVKNNMFFDKHSLHLPPIALLYHSYYAIPDYSTHEKKMSRNPDFRQLLYWDPSLNIPGKQNIPVEFYTSDNKGTYTVKIEGIAADGKPVSCEAYFDVR